MNGKKKKKKNRRSPTQKGLSKNKIGTYVKFEICKILSDMEPTSKIKLRDFFSTLFLLSQKWGTGRSGETRVPRMCSMTEPLLNFVKIWYGILQMGLWQKNAVLVKKKEQNKKQHKNQ